jgi:hypothetical protein
VEALVNGGPMETIVAQIKVEEERKRELNAEYEAMAAASDSQAFDCASIVRQLRQRTADVRAVLGRQTTQARQMLRKLLDGKISVEPITIDGQRASGCQGARTSVACFAPTSCECSRWCRRLPKMTARRWWPQRDSNPCFSLERAVS